MSSKHQSTETVAFARVITSLEQALDAFPAVSLNLELVAIFRILRSLYDLSLLQTPVGSSPNATQSPASPSASAPSNTTDLMTDVTSKLAKLETLTQQLRESFGQVWDGLETSDATRPLLNSLFTVATHTASCVKSLATAVTTAAAQQPLPSKPSSTSKSSQSSNESTLTLSLHTSAGSKTWTTDYVPTAIWYLSQVENGGSLAVELNHQRSERPLRMTLKEVLPTS